ncbi:SDR family oxidoreductase [Noviherbaspirillum malthae]|jgi:NADP-dependent 3-hydroxy acid dehydrogenase YdfG|uniref:SDR family oxidoreductase n=1 Tax=Noviherbaspirillum malthae TaxID=1260987 RepID=UPI0018900E01|nr:SDR family oxidoreductase [Noviherbaspirillum malthae]
MTLIQGNIAWITGAGSGIGLAGAQALAQAGLTVVMSGRRRELLETEAEAIIAKGGKADIEVLDVCDAESVQNAAQAIHGRHGRIDILVNSAGLNVPNRFWKNQNAQGWNEVIRVNLDGSFYCISAVLPFMREQKSGLIINVSSWAGKYDTYMTGPAYNAAKHGVVAMTEHLNQEECVNGIRACALCPGEVATPIMDKRPIPPSPEERARMLQPEDLGRTIRFIAEMPPHVCLNEITISPTWNRIFLGAADIQRS